MRDETIRPSPNIWRWPDIYERENRAHDADGTLWAAVTAAAPLDGDDMVDIGCGDGFHLPAFAARAATVVGVEPHPPTRERAQRRVAGHPRIRVIAGTAARLPLPDASADVLHARTAYFFGPGCEPGLREADRVLRPGGRLVVVDLDGAAAPYGDWLCADNPGYDPRRVEEFFAAEGFRSRTVTSRWSFDRRADLEAVLRIEFSRPVAARAIAETPGTELHVAYRVRVRAKPAGIVAG